MSVRLVALSALLISALPLSAKSPPGPASVQLPAAARAAAATIDAFHAALRRGDTKAALALMTDDALVYESGHAERGKSAYAKEHLAADAEYSAAVRTELKARSGGAEGRLAWVASEGRTKGDFRGKPVNRVTAETMVLRREKGGWKIAHIHWSSAAAPVAK